MTDLIKVTEQADGQQAVSARELHEFLEVRTQFSKWIDRMIDAYGFEKYTDFITISQKRLTVQGNETTFIDYVISLDMAKELSMVQRTERGKQARQYFITCEKKLKTLTVPSYQIDDEIERAIRWAEERREERSKRLLLENTIIEQQPLVELAIKRISKDGCMSITDVTKTFNLKRGALTKYAKEAGYIHKKNIEVNKLGEEYFKVYDNSGFRAIGVTEAGIRHVQKLLDSDAL